MADGGIVTGFEQSAIGDTRYQDDSSEDEHNDRPHVRNAHPVAHGTRSYAEVILKAVATSSRRHSVINREPRRYYQSAALMHERRKAWLTDSIRVRARPIRTADQKRTASGTRAS